ncbi:hypothetical protein Adt_03599 [Abeliophyllum distichum]|uniref:Uncharacterized protein n=1 Tax=Abeliophyllum distichum TaxID=126358 RepID=A0ABD1VZ30_9LAMI
MSSASMAKVMSHGGDGAGDHLHQSPRRLDLTCESAPPSKRRRISQGINLNKPIKNNTKYFTRLVGNQVMFTVPPCYPLWIEVLEEQRARLRSIIESYFDLQDDRSPDKCRTVCAAVDHLAADRY